MADQDLGFTFDTSFFEKGIQKVTKGMDTLKSTANGVAKGISNGFNKILTKVGALFVGLKGIKGLLNNMPEIGTAFGITKDIFLKNFLFPLRQEVLPILQKMLDWARDNRTTFVRMGTALVNIFRVIGRVAKGVFGGIRDLINGILDRIGVKTSGMLNNLEELVNVVMFKIAVIAEFMLIALEPIKNIILDIVDFLAPAVSGFFTGLFSKFSEIGVHITNLLDNLKRIGEKIFNLSDGGETVRRMFQTIGEIVGEIVVAITGFVSEFIGGFADKLPNISGKIQAILNNVKGIIEEITRPNEDGFSILTVGRKIGEIFGTIANTVTTIIQGLSGGFLDGIQGIMTPIQGIADAFGRIFDRLFGSPEKQDKLKNFFETVGKIFGETLVIAFKVIEGVVLVIEKVVNTIADVFGVIIKPLISVAELIFPQLKEARLAREREEALAKGQARFLSLSPEEQEKTLKLAERAGVTREQVLNNLGVTVDMTGTQFIVTEGNAQAAGENFGAGLMEGMEDQFNREFERQGG